MSIWYQWPTCVADDAGSHGIIRWLRGLARRMRGIGLRLLSVSSLDWFGERQSKDVADEDLLWRTYFSNLPPPLRTFELAPNDLTHGSTLGVVEEPSLCTPTVLYLTDWNQASELLPAPKKPWPQ